MSYIFDANEDPEQRKKRRRVAEAMLGRMQRMPTNVGEGLASIGDALAYRAARVKAQGPFPDAPGGQPVGLGTQIANKFGFGRGGLW